MTSPSTRECKLCSVVPEVCSKLPANSLFCFSKFATLTFDDLVRVTERSFWSPATSSTVNIDCPIPGDESEQPRSQNPSYHLTPAYVAESPLLLSHPPVTAAPQADLTAMNLWNPAVKNELVAADLAAHLKPLYIAC
jgi:hypothetical protein